MLLLLAAVPPAAFRSQMEPPTNDADAPAREQEDDQVVPMDEANAVHEFCDLMSQDLQNSLVRFVESVNQSTTELTQPALSAFNEKMLVELNAKVETLRDLREQNHELETKLYAVHHIAASFTNSVVQTLDGGEHPMADDDVEEEAPEQDSHEEPDTMAADEAGSVGVAAGEDEDAPTGDDASHVDEQVDDGKRALEEESAEKVFSSPSISPEKPPPADAVSVGDAAAADKSASSSPNKRQRRAPGRAAVAK